MPLESGGSVCCGPAAPSRTMLREYQPLNCILVKPAGPDCNLRCSYCFYLEKEKLFSPGVHRMSLETLELVTRQVLENPVSTFSFIWQGGEPTLAGLHFFEKAVELQKRYAGATTVTNALQTNGSTINSEWGEFFRRNEFLVGVSLDGPQHIHDHYRRSPDGDGSWHTVFLNARLLLDAGVMTNSVSCVTAYAAEHAHETYCFLREAGFDHMQFIPVVEPDGNGGVADFSVSPEAYGDFLITLFDTWRADFRNGQPTASIRLFDTIFFTIMGHPAPECGMRRTCGLYLAVEHNGDVFPCDFFVEPTHRLGNVDDYKLGDLLNAKQQRLFGGAKANLAAKCRKCKWLKFCGGGCLKDRRYNPGGERMNYFCRSMKKFLPHAVPVLQEMAKRWQG